MIRDVLKMGDPRLLEVARPVEHFDSPELRALIEKTQQSPAADAHERVKFYKLAWDVLGSEFGSRHTQYEMFYAGATFVTKGHSYRCYDWQTAGSLVDRMLASYTLENELPAEVRRLAG